MNKPNYLFLIIILFIWGCSPPPERTGIPMAPEIISMTSLPPLTEDSQLKKPELPVIFLIKDDGTVEDVKLLATSGNPDWDNAVIDSLKKWRFTPPIDDIDINGRWIRYRIRIEIEEPVFMNLGEIVAFSKDEADSLYLLLRKKTDFIDLAGHIREGTTETIGNIIGTVNIARFPEHVRKELRKLRVNQYTQPVRIGDTYIIYKRFDDHKTDL